MTAEERINSLRLVLNETDAKPDAISLGLFWTKTQLEAGFRFGGYALVPTKKNGKVLFWKLRLFVCRTDSEGTPEICTRDF
jgi:hypothetical protein